MSYARYAALLSLGLFAGMLILLEVGRRIGVHRLAKDPEGVRAGAGAASPGIHFLGGWGKIRRVPNLNC
jgi:hypothetical protein